MRHLLHFGLFVFILTAVTRADAQDRRRAVPHTRVTVVSTAGLRATDPRRAYIEERRDLEDITRIARGWHRAAASGNRHAELAFDRRLHAWLDREIRESIRTSGDHRYAMQIRALSKQLATLDRRPHRGQVSHRGGHRSQQGYYERKALIIDELVDLSEQRARRAYAVIHRPIRLSFAHR
jgi:hypothetical protein